MTNASAITRVEGLRPIAERLKCTMAQLALAWCTLSPNVSSVITNVPCRQVIANSTLDVISNHTRGEGGDRSGCRRFRLGAPRPSLHSASDHFGGSNLPRSSSGLDATLKVVARVQIPYGYASQLAWVWLWD